MGSGQDDYRWLVLSARLWWKDSDEDEKKPGDAQLKLAEISGVCGRFTNVDTKSANDLAARLLLLLIFLLACAKYRAKLWCHIQFSREIGRRQILNPIPLYPAPSLEIPALLLGMLAVTNI